MAVVITTIYSRTRSNEAVTATATTAVRSVKKKQLRSVRGCKTCWGAVVARLKPLKTKPEFKGAKAFRTSGEPLLCRDCARYAQFRAMEFKGNARTDLYFCEVHLIQVITEMHGIRKVAPLKEWSQYQARLKRWDEQLATKSQETMFP
jgi:hypothetical protein